MRDYIIPITLFAACLSALTVNAQPPGEFSLSAKGLPVYQYTGALPASALDNAGNDADLPEDPHFLMGNYRMALIAHASGIYQLLTAERAWARLNAAPQTNYGYNDASITVSPGGNGQDKTAVKTGLVGLSGLATDAARCKKRFGVGFASYQYLLGDVTCTRVLSVKPSPRLHEGNPSFIISVCLKNNSRQPQTITYQERMLVNYVQNGTQYTAPQQRPLIYTVAAATQALPNIAVAKIQYKRNSFLVLPSAEERYPYELKPPDVFMYASGARGAAPTVQLYKDTLAANTRLTLSPGDSSRFYIIIGLAYNASNASVQQQVNGLLSGAAFNDQEDGLFAAQWKKRLPDLSQEKNEVLRREMLWNAYFIEASAKYSAYYKETFIPQGTVYSYYFGDNISNRDHLQAALPACYTNPALAKSILRYVIKHAERDGEIKRGNAGMGYTAPSIFKESDEQLYFFNTLAEYLLITKDYSFLQEKVRYYPAENSHADDVLTMLKKFFIYLRDEIGTGPNGLIKMLNSDWSDSFFHEYSPDRYAGSAESHLNTAMALAVIPKLVQALQLAPAAKNDPFIPALQDYRSSISAAFMKDLGNRSFAARAYLNRQLKFGVDNVCIEPQGYLLQIPDLPVERKKEIYATVKEKLLLPEKIGIRTREKPLWKGHPDGEDGGIWFSLEYPVLLGVASFDKAEARALLLRFSFDNFAREYPNYWVGQWTAADEVNSSLYRPGLYSFWVPSPDRKRAFQGWCSHPHTWPLFCYYKLKE
ncbi:MAG TPA: hypothetical protein VL307_06280 [Chitinophagaceae bacterium]|nr:hypothetical protein [Chitinophagaceae bacterium]